MNEKKSRPQQTTRRPERLVLTLIEGVNTNELIGTAKTLCVPDILWMMDEVELLTVLPQTNVTLAKCIDAMVSVPGSKPPQMTINLPYEAFNIAVIEGVLKTSPEKFVSQQLQDAANMFKALVKVIREIHPPTAATIKFFSELLSGMVIKWS